MLPGGKEDSQLDWEGLGWMDRWIDGWMDGHKVDGRETRRKGFAGRRWAVQMYILTVLEMLL